MLLDDSTATRSWRTNVRSESGGPAPATPSHAGLGRQKTFGLDGLVRAEVAVAVGGVVAAPGAGAVGVEVGAEGSVGQLHVQLGDFHVGDGVGCGVLGRDGGEADEGARGADAAGLAGGDGGAAALAGFLAEGADFVLEGGGTEDVGRGGEHVGGEEAHAGHGGRGGGGAGVEGCHRRSGGGRAGVGGGGILGDVDNVAIVSDVALVVNVPARGVRGRGCIHIRGDIPDACLSSCLKFKF